MLANKENTKHQCKRAKSAAAGMNIISELQRDFAQAVEAPVGIFTEQTHLSTLEYKVRHKCLRTHELRSRIIK